MGCLICEDLERIFRARLAEYAEACSSECYRVNKKFAAHKNVEMERARYELEEHRSVCLAARRPPVILPQREAPKSIRHFAA